MTPIDVTFYFGAASRYSYLAASQLDALSKRTGARFDWIPLNVLKLFELRGRSPFSPSPVSGQYEAAWRRQDAERWAALYGMPFIEPAGRLALDMELLARACAVAREAGLGQAYGQAMMHRIFATEGIAADAASCIDLAGRLGMDGDEFGAMLKDGRSARQVDAIALQANQQRVFGVPSFVVGDEVFWGNDRLALLEHRLTAIAEPSAAS